MEESYTNRPAKIQDRERLIYAASTNGHRQSYIDTLAPIFRLTPVSGTMTPELFQRLTVAECLLFASLDDDMFSFGAIATLRAMLGRPTMALFLRAQKCFERGHWHHILKRGVFRSLRRLPNLTVATITPFNVAPHYSEVAHVGVVDPQYWDLCNGTSVRRPPDTALSTIVQTRADGRKVICCLGSPSDIKGLPFLVETLERDPDILHSTLVVVTGRSLASASSLVRRLVDVGTLIVDRYVTNTELESMYGVADAIWACYRPDYDQASGVFGRAVQLGVPPIVRDGSIIHKFALSSGIVHYRAQYGDIDTLAELFHNLRKAPHERAKKIGEREQLISEWRRNFIETVDASLTSNRSIDHRGFLID